MFTGTMAQNQIHSHETTALTPEQYIAGLTDFGPGRSTLLGNSADQYLKVHHMGRTAAVAQDPLLGFVRLSALD